ncbi:hypothetical protein C0J52_20474 [Blattella germanica]|nr:hypothetical protein C0J52_20474 [Blattella germanica]
MATCSPDLIRFVLLLFLTSAHIVHKRKYSLGVSTVLLSGPSFQNSHYLISN